jgi:glycosyltransferase involved in cell wall biosynthesis
MNLAIISHTEHYKSADDVISGWGATVREINHLSKVFDKIYHIAPLYDAKPVPGSIPYDSDNIHFIPLKPSGGNTLIKKFSVVTTSIHNIGVVKKALKDVDIYQFRAPTGMGLYLIPWLNWFSGKAGWVKFAGNWQQKNAPLGYAIQKWMLKRMTKRKVTINGEWDDQPKHCISFENPCLTLEERDKGRNMLMSKDYSGVLNFCFIGRLEEAKGVDVIIDAFKLIGDNERVGKVHFIGDGPDLSYYLDTSKPIADKCLFHGFLNRTQIESILQECHVFLLPSASEGFPKVVAEAANYGCVPVVTDVSCIGQYIHDGSNGYLLPEENRTGSLLKAKILEILSNSDLDKMAYSAWDLSAKFTFNHYNQRVLDELL